MNDPNMLDELKIVNNRILKMLNSSEVNSEIFYADVRTLAELTDAKLKREKREDRA